MRFRLSLSAALLLLPAIALGVQRRDTLYINRGQFVTIKNTSFPALAFNHSKTFERSSATITLHVGDTLSLAISNNDTTNHLFRIQGEGPFDFGLLPGETRIYPIIAQQSGVLLYYDQSR